ncbi:hypothetical protein BJ741DRAFT_610698 [Chytriomyces cf. hyalinus JEL632]|nr:hypothetical protein BJ741DRAFT_610698 [Chytriomyces cf. hyalinus JEL632]
MAVTPAQCLLAAAFVYLIQTSEFKLLWLLRVERQFTPSQIQGGGLFLVGLFSTWLTYMLFFAIDISGWPAFISKSKLQPSVKATLKMYRKAAPLVFFNGLVVNSVISYLSTLNPNNPIKTSSAEIPNAPTAIRDLAFCLIFREITFYAGHVLLHHPSIYKYVHKIHHEFTAPMAMASTYAHPLEHIACNILPVALGPILFQSHILVAAFFIFNVAIQSACVHSGYMIPLFDSALSHDFHHMKFNSCFGTTLGLCDWVFGTGPSELELETLFHARAVTQKSRSPSKKLKEE